VPGHSPLEHGRYTLDCLNSNRRFTIVCELYSKACDGSRQDGGVRRIAAMLLLGPALDANYLAVKADNVGNVAQMKLPEFGGEDRYRARATIDNLDFDYCLKVLGQRAVRSQTG
jgi:hypothetical protein